MQRPKQFKGFHNVGAFAGEKRGVEGPRSGFKIPGCWKN